MALDDNVTIKNKVKLVNNILIKETNADTYIIRNTQTSPDEPEESTGKDEEKTYSISGTVWFDENSDGSRDVEEQKLSEVDVYLLDTNTNEIKKETKTNEQGFYEFTNIDKGNYIVIFGYDTNQFIPTIYKAESVQEDSNSDAIKGTSKIYNETKTIAKTEALSLTNNLTNIDLGLIKAEKFDLELNKYVNKITVQNSKGTKVTEFNKSGLAKVEIAAKDLRSSNVFVEYIIEVRNTGEIPGFVQSIVDYKSKDFEFDLSLNKDWYKSGDYIYNDSLKGTEINQGETKEIKLILSKKMTKSNTGLINNTAEIARAYNEKQITDVDSVPGNNQTEDDLGTADVIISIKTGMAITYILLVLSLSIIVGVVVYLIRFRHIK